LDFKVNIFPFCLENTLRAGVLVFDNNKKNCRKSSVYNGQMTSWTPAFVHLYIVLVFDNNKKTVENFVFMIAK
jgi:hypothetical protein